MIILTGRPATKKNHGRIVMRGKYPILIPSKTFVDYEKNCLKQLKSCEEKYTGEIWCKCEYWLPDKKWYPDLINLLSATHDILEKAGIIDNDRNIVNIDGSKIIGFDKTNPRAEITISNI